MKHRSVFLVLLSICSLFLWSCNCGCDNGESSVNIFGSCDCECYGDWYGSDCNLCGVECKGGGTPNDLCTACDCPEGFTGPYCDSVIGVNQSMTMFITDNTGTVQCTELLSDLSIIEDEFVFSGQYAHPATQHSYSLKFYIAETDMEIGSIAFYSDNTVLFDDHTSNDSFSTTYGQIHVNQYDKANRFISGYYYFDAVSDLTEMNLGITGEFLLYY